jgi:hypothetical protein
MCVLRAAPKIRRMEVDKFRAAPRIRCMEVDKYDMYGSIVVQQE